MNDFQKAVAAYKEILASMTMREIAEEMGWEFPLGSHYRKSHAVRDAAIMLARREHPVPAAHGSAYWAEAEANH